jgi:hypothetical protein
MKEIFRYLTRRLALTAWVISAAMLVVGPGCTEFGSFKFTEDSNVQTIQGTSLPVSGPLGSLAFDFNLEQELEKRDVKAAKGVYLNSLTLEITEDAEPEGDTDNFNFLESIRFVASSGDGDNESVLAERENIPDEGIRTLNVPVTADTNLKPYIEEGLTLSTEGQGSPPEDDTSVKGIITLEVEVL